MLSLLDVWVTALLVALLSCSPALIAGESEDGDPDAAEEPAGREADQPWYKRLVVVPSIITEPAVGEGLALGVGYFHPAKSGDASQPRSLENTNAVRDARVARKPPPTVTGAFGAATNNGTWVGGVGHMGTFRNDRIRYLGVAAYANVVTDFYVLDQPFEFELEGFLVYQDVKFRLFDSNWFLGTALSYLDATTRFDLAPPEPDEGFDTNFISNDLRDVGITAQLEYDSRDDTLMPGRGQLLDLALVQNGEWLSGDYEYTTLKLKALSFHPLGERFVLGLRGEYSTVGGHPPFYSVPWVTLRGIPAMRYQGKKVAVAEVEVRFNFNENWAAVAFAGKGWTNSDRQALDTGDDIRSHGIGGRYRLLKEQNVWVGIDLARGPEDSVYYVQVGHPW